MNNIKIIGIDLDGTLLNRKRIVSEQDKTAIRMCIDKGIQVYLITGRPYCFAKYIASTIADGIHVISANGGLYEIGNRIQQQSIHKDALSRIIKYLSSSTAHAFFKGKHDFYTHEPYDKRFLYDHMNIDFASSLQVCSHTDMTWEALQEQVHDIVKILVYDLDEEKLRNVRDKIECIEGITLTDYQKISFDITGDHVNKGIAINDILKYYRFQKENFMAIGDAHNDISMFHEAGLKIAMGNADDEIKAYCDAVTTDCDHSGVANAIQTYITIQQ